MLRSAVVVVGCVVGVLFVSHRERPVPMSAVAPKVADSVQVEHRLVTVEAAPRPLARGVVRVAQKAAPVKRSDTERRPFITRATQLVLGDGRLRPEPFPRPAVR